MVAGGKVRDVLLNSWSDRSDRLRQLRNATKLMAGLARCWPEMDRVGLNPYGIVEKYYVLESGTLNSLVSCILFLRILGHCFNAVISYNAATSDVRAGLGLEARAWARLEGLRAC